MFPVISSLLEAYDRSKRNQEHYDDFDEWKKAVRQAGGDYYMPKKGESFYVANAHDGKCGEFDTEDGEGWLVAKWYKKPVDESKDMMGKTHEGCGGKFEETSQMDDMDGVLHCTKCGKETKRHLKEAKKADKGPVGVPNPSPAAKKNRKMAKHVVDAYADHIRTSGHNKTYAKKHRDKMTGLQEGMFVVKSADGVEKRFRDGSSPEAKEWARTIKKKVAATKYSHDWWAAQDDASDDRDFITPWTKLDGYDSTDAILKAIESEGSNHIEDWTSRPSKNIDREGVPCAAATVRVVFSYGKEDDMGVDEPTTDTQSMLVARNPKKPKQVDFIKYV